MNTSNINEKDIQTAQSSENTNVEQIKNERGLKLTTQTAYNKLEEHLGEKRNRIFWRIFLNLQPLGIRQWIGYLLGEKKDEIYKDKNSLVKKIYNLYKENNLRVQRGYKLYKDKNFRGLAQEPIRLMNTTVRGQELLDLIKTTMEDGLKEKNIPAKVVEAEVRSGGIFKGEILPMIVIENTEPKNKYFHIGIIVNDDALIFPLLGESKENTKNNRSEYYKNENTVAGDLKSAIYAANQFKLQREVLWRDDVLACLNENLE